MNTFECIRARRSVRAFLPAPVEPEKLDAIAQAALYAPVGMRAYETMHLTVVTDKAVLDRFTAMAREQAGDAQADPIHGAPALIVVSVSRPEPVPFANAACMIENMLLAATELGLGSLYVCGAVNALRDSADFRALLRLPEGFVPVGSAAIGYAESAPAPRPLQNTVTQVDRI